LVEFQRARRDGDTDEPYRDRVEFDAYDIAGNLVEQTQFSTDFINERHPQRIDAQTIVFHATMGDRTEHLTFNSKGNVTERQVFLGTNTEGEAFQTLRYKYDAAGRMIEEDLIDVDGGPLGVTLISRDDKGNVVREEYRYDPPPYLVAVFSCEFDARGNWIKRTESRNDPAQGIETLEPFGTRFRTITYYDSEAGQLPAAAN
jgi:hypothetical protein